MTSDGGHEVLVCRGPECGDRRFAADIAAEFRRLIKARGLESRVKVDRYCCFGKCRSGPNVLTREIGPGGPPLVVAPGPGSRLHLGVRPAEIGGILDGLVRSAGASAAPPVDAALAPPPSSRDY
jgi:hypothetical protein